MLIITVTVKCYSDFYVRQWQLYHSDYAISAKDSRWQLAEHTVKADYEGEESNPNSDPVFCHALSQQTRPY